MKQIKHILIAAMVLVMVAMFANANIPPAPAEMNNDTGNYWVNYTWSKDTDHPDNDNVTDSFNVSMNGMWYNRTATFLNKSVGPGGWANITVWTYNATELRGGEYSAIIVIENNDPEEDPVEIPVTLTVLEPCTCGDICVDTGGWWRNNSTFNASETPIQAAVDNADAGETIYVWNGSYSENVNVDGRVTLRGEGADVVNVRASTSDHVFDVTADYVNISGFNVTGATGDWKAGIHLNAASHCNISDNNCTNNENGIMLEDSSNDNMLTNNNASNNYDCGIMLGLREGVADGANNNTLTGNTASNNYGYGIWMGYSSSNVLTDNNAS
ncbi:MAG: right-handed parallel beta-helix repeat-containing protein, partial [Candidatus Methanogasteraceae archaeon]